MKTTKLIWAIASLFALVPAALFATWVAGNQRPDEHMGKFTGSALMGDKKVGIAAVRTWDVLHHFDPFSMSRPGALFGTRSLGRHDSEFANNRFALIRIDMDTYATKVLYEEFTDEFIRNAVEFDIRETAGDKVLLSWHDEGSSDFRLLDVKTGELTWLRVYEHLDRFGLSGPVNPRLVSPEGDLLVKSAEGNFLLRRASGDWLQLEYSHNFTTVYEGKLYFYTGKGHFAYDMDLDQSTRADSEDMKAVSAFRWRKSTGGLMTRGHSFTDESNKLEHYTQSATGDMTSSFLPLRAADIR